MRENFLHYLWKLKIFDCTNLTTTKGEQITLISVGDHNLNSGPDFFNSQLKLGNQLWAGNIELHVNASDWHKHKHQKDSNYDNVILHVVWNYDSDVIRNKGAVIPTLELKQYISQNTLVAYNTLFSEDKKLINCENDFPKIDSFIINNWLERLYIERLERKCKHIKSLLNQTANNWDAVFFMLLSKSFGLKVNGDAFLSMSKSIDFAIIRKEQHEQLNLEALFMGQSRFFNAGSNDPYFIQLSKIYTYLKAKYKLKNEFVQSVQFFRLRPANFPTIRLSQLAGLYYHNQHLFSKVMASKNAEELYKLLAIGPSEFWETHYTFDKQSKQSKKRLTKAFINLLISNTIIPFKYAYAKHNGKIDTNQILELIQCIPAENNTIVNLFNELRKTAINAMQSQALIQLKSEYCDKNRCLQCAIGCSILKQ